MRAAIGSVTRPGDTESAAYRAPAARAEAELLEKGSRFRAVVAPVAGEREARAALDAARRRFAGATHVCSAWRLGGDGADCAERAADAGEPSGTAGPPILSALRGAGLRDVLAIVARWYGGVNLGRGGLVRAYGGVVREALQALPTVVHRPKRRLLIELPYDRQGGVRRLVRAPDVVVVEERFGELLRLVLEVTTDRLPALLGSLADLGIAVTEIDDTTTAAPSPEADDFA